MTRRTHHQYLAFKKLPRSRWISGDGPFVVLFKCVEPWRYVLCGDWLDSLVTARRSCGPQCKGPAFHRYWKLLEENQPKPAPTKVEKSDPQSMFNFGSKK